MRKKGKVKKNMNLNISYQILKEKRKVIATAVVDNQKFEGIAICGEEDTFSETIGKDIAKNKLCIKLAKERVKAFEREKERVLEVIQNLQYLTLDINKELNNTKFEIENRENIIKSY